MGLATVGWGPSWSQFHSENYDSDGGDSDREGYFQVGQISSNFYDIETDS